MGNTENASYAIVVNPTKSEGSIPVNAFAMNLQKTEVVYSTDENDICDETKKLHTEDNHENLQSINTF